MIEKGRESARAYYAAGGYHEGHENMRERQGGINWEIVLGMIFILKLIFYVTMHGR